jgi:hypothetical protein
MVLIDTASANRTHILSSENLRSAFKVSRRTTLEGGDSSAQTPQQLVLTWLVDASNAPVLGAAGSGAAGPVANMAAAAAADALSASEPSSAV